MEYAGFKERYDTGVEHGYTIALDVGISKTGRPPFGVYGGTSPSNVALIPYMGTYYIVVTVNRDYYYEPGISRVQPVSGAKVDLVVKHGGKVVFRRTLVTNTKGYAKVLYTFDMLGEYRVVATYKGRVAEFKAIITFNPSLFKIEDYVCKGTDDTCTDTSIEVSPGSPSNPSLVTVHGTVTYSGRHVSGFKVAIEGEGGSPPVAYVKDGRFKVTMLIGREYSGKRIVLTPVMRIGRTEIRGNPLEVIVSPPKKEGSKESRVAGKAPEEGHSVQKKEKPPEEARRSAERHAPAGVIRKAPSHYQVPERYSPERAVPGFPIEKKAEVEEAKRPSEIERMIRIAGIVAGAAVGATIIYSALKSRKRH